MWIDFSSKLLTNLWVVTSLVSRMLVLLHSIAIPVDCMTMCNH